MAAGKPVVVRDIETFSWLDDGENCLKVGGERDADGSVRPERRDAIGDDVAEFVDAIDELRDPERRAELGAAAAERSEAFSLSAIAERYWDLYDDLT